MIAMNGRYDGKVIVPEKPLALPANQRVRIHVEPISVGRADFRTWIGLGLRKPTNPHPRFTNDVSLWE
jgi:hypothetical protein